jgi:hypothetical protein
LVFHGKDQNHRSEMTDLEGEFVIMHHFLGVVEETSRKLIQ